MKSLKDDGQLVDVDAGNGGNAETRAIWAAATWYLTFVQDTSIYWDHKSTLATILRQATCKAQLCLTALSRLQLAY